MDRPARAQSQTAPPRHGLALLVQIICVGNPKLFLDHPPTYTLAEYNDDVLRGLDGYTNMNAHRCFAYFKRFISLYFFCFVGLCLCVFNHRLFQFGIFIHFAFDARWASYYPSCVLAFCQIFLKIARRRRDDKCAHCQMCGGVLEKNNADDETMWSYGIQYVCSWVVWIVLPSPDLRCVPRSVSRRSRAHACIYIWSFERTSRSQLSVPSPHDKFSVAAHSTYTHTHTHWGSIVAAQFCYFGRARLERRRRRRLGSLLRAFVLILIKYAFPEWVCAARTKRPSESESVCRHHTYRASLK